MQKNNKHQIELQKLFDICSFNLNNFKDCREYLTNRNISDELIKEFSLGYFPLNVEKLKEFVDPDILGELSITPKYGSCYFSEYYHLIIPIFDEYSLPIGFSGRVLFSDDDRKLLDLPKYKNTSFRKARYLYGLNKAIESIVKEKNVYVVEGYFDQISMWANGFKNTVAVCGAAFSKYHFYKLSRYTDKFTFILDNDNAGEVSMKKIYDTYSSKGFKLRFLSLPDGYKDIDEYLRKKGNDNFFSDLSLFTPGW